jgi:hypothetical protein
VLVVNQDPAPNSLVSDQSSVVRVNLATGSAGKAFDVGPGAQGLVMSPDGLTVYSFVTGPYHSGLPHYGPGGVVPIATATGAPGKSVPVGTLPQALAIAQPPLDQVQDETATQAVESQLVAAFAAGSHVKPSQVAGTSPGSVHYAYDATARAYWAEAAFRPAKGDPPAMMQDAGAFGVFSRTSGSAWKYLGSSLPISCEELAVVPPAVLDLWGVAPTDAAYCRS